MMNNLQQILPGFVLSPDASFDNFFATDDVVMVKDTLKHLANTHAPESLFLCGVNGVGKSHLLQAFCHEITQSGGSALYLPLRELKQYEPAEIFDNTEAIDWLCLDDIDEVIGVSVWEEALFHLYNHRRQLGKSLIFSASSIVNELDVKLPDLRTRLTACLCFQLTELTDEQKIALVQWRANSAGMELNDVCALFIIQRSGRQLSELLAVLARLEKESLMAGRKVTIPFIKSVFHW